MPKYDALLSNPFAGIRIDDPVAAEKFKTMVKANTIPVKVIVVPAKPPKAAKPKSKGKRK